MTQEEQVKALAEEYTTILEGEQEGITKVKKAIKIAKWSALGIVGTVAVAYAVKKYVNVDQVIKVVEDVEIVD